MPTSFFKDKTVTLVGLGLLGRGVGDAAFLAQQCQHVFVTDTKSADELRVSVKALKDYKNITFFLGGHDYTIFTNVDFIIKGAGVRLDNPYIEHAKAHHIPVYMSTALFAHLSPLKTIGVTGTRGKTTTTMMIAAILKQAGKKVLLGGNLRGLSTLAHLTNPEPYDYAVLELDSWQLQGFDDLHISPNISVFTNLYPDHMNYYDGDMNRYLHDKTAIFRHQKAGDSLVTSQPIPTTESSDQRVPLPSPPPCGEGQGGGRSAGCDVSDSGACLPSSTPPSPALPAGGREHPCSSFTLRPELLTVDIIEKERGNSPADWILAPSLPATFSLKVPGAHNLLNASLAKAVGTLCGIEEKTIDDALHSFEAVEGRLQFVRQWNKRSIYNDNNATTQEATLAALTAFPPSSIVLIFGGADKGLPIDRLVNYIAENKIRCVLIKGDGSDRIRQTLPHIEVATTMQEAVRMATDLSKPQDTILMSPAFASFSIFKNEYERNDQFMIEIQNLKEDNAESPTHA